MVRGIWFLAIAGLTLTWLGAPAEAGKKKMIPSKYDGAITDVKLDTANKKVISLTLDAVEMDKKKKGSTISTKTFQINEKTHIAFYKLDEPEDKKIKVGNFATVFIDTTTPSIATWITVRPKGVPAPNK